MSEQTSQQTAHRRRLPDTRHSLTHKFSVEGHEGYVTVGLFEDGRPGEMFIKMAKEGSTIGGLMDTIGILTSLALQYGVPPDKLVSKLEYSSFQPAGHTGHAAIGPATSVVDYIFRWLGLTFSSEESGTPATDHCVDESQTQKEASHA